MSDWKELKKEFYGKGFLVTIGSGVINFNPNAMKEIVGGERLTYDEYLEIEWRSRETKRTWFERCYYEGVSCGFIGEIEKISKDNVCFKYIRVEGMYSDGIGFSGKENHVWIRRQGFEDFKKGEKVRFTADVYKYLKTGNGKYFDYSLRKPYNAERVEKYDVPDDDELLLQAVDQMVCEVCMFNEHCYMGMCIANEEWRDNLRKTLFAAAKSKA